MRNEYKLYNEYKLFIYEGVEFNFMQKYGKAVRVRLGNSIQNIFIPLSCFNVSDGIYSIKDGYDLNWLLNSRDVKNKLMIYKKL